MSTGIELDRLLNLALGSPEQGAVNFNILHGVLGEILKTLGVEKKVVQFDNGKYEGAFGLLSAAADVSHETGAKDTKYNNGIKRPSSGKSRTQLNGVNGEVLDKISKLESRLKVLDDLPDNIDILKRARDKKDGKASNSTVGDVWQFINLNKRVSATEAAIEKFTSLLEQVMTELGTVQDIQSDVSNMKKSISEMEERNGKLMERLQSLENSDNKEDSERIKNLQNNLDNLENQIKGLPTKKDIDSCIKWPEFETALKHGSSGFDNSQRHGQSKATNSSGSAATTSPNTEVLDTIKQIGSIVEGQEKVLTDILNLQETMPTKADKKDVDELMKRPAVPDDLLAQVNGLKTHTQDLMDWKNEMVNKIKGRNSLPPINGQLLPKSKGIEDLDHMSKSIKDCQENIHKLNVSTRNLTEDGMRRQRLIDEFNSSVEHLRETKADKDALMMELESKADKLALDNMVSRQKFDTSVIPLEQSLQNILNRLSDQEAALRDAISKINTEVDGKLDRLEMDPLKDYINKRIKANKCKHGDLPISDDPSAAGMTKPSMKFHCISCARPIDVQPGMNAIPLPHYPSFPPSRSNRPYTPYDMENMRQLTRTQYEGTDHSSTRPCGGAHTMTYSARRVNVNKTSPQYNNYNEQEEIIVPLRDETALQGQDGQLYKGRNNDYSNEQLPTLQQQTSPKSSPKSPVVANNPQTSPRCHTPTRPRSAAAIR